MSRSAGYAERTIGNRAAILRPLSRWLDVRLLEATTADLRAYLGRRELDPATGELRPVVKPSTTRIERAAMLAFYGYAEDEQLVAVSPAAKLAPVKVPRNLPRPFTREQIAALLDSGAYRRTRMMILLGYLQGFRVSQIARVQGSDIDLGAMQIRTVAKGSKERWLPLHPIVAEASKTMPAGWWFPSPSRVGPILPGSVSDAILEAKRRAGITDERLTAHSLRHSFGSELVEAGVDIRVVQELMLHEDISSTQIYTSVSDRRKRAGLDLLPGVAVPASSGRRRPASSQLPADDRLAA